MPVARFQMQDGRVVRFEVPEGTTPEQAQSMVSQYLARSQPTQSWRDDPIVSPPKRSKAPWENDPIISPAPKAREADEQPEAMSGPWEAYQEQKQSGPWEAYAKQERDAPAQQVKGAYDDILNEPKGNKRGAYDDILEAKPETFLGMDKGKLKAVGQGAKDAAGGFTRSGMGIVSNLMRPFEALIPGGNDFDSGNAERMARVDQRFKNKGYNPNAIAFQAGKLGGDIVATAPVGGFLGAGVKAVSKAPAATAFANALQTGGMRAGATPGAANMLTRVAGGATTGGAMAGAVDMDSAGTGAMIGGALPPALRAAGAARKLIRKGAGSTVTNLLGATTGTGAESITGAYNAGKAGSTKFLDNMRGKVSFDDVVGEAKGALGKMREARAADYRSGMVDISNDKAVIAFKPIDDAMRRIGQMGSYKGQQINKNAAGTVDDLTAMIDNWRSLDPAEYHTPEGLDALKQAIGDIRDSTQFGTAARRATDEVYNAVKNQITAQAPTYAKVMKDYSEASALLKEIESGLSLGSKASKDTAVRKLQSLLRNNAQTNYGNRLNLASQLERKGGADLMPSLAGQSMSSAMPRGLSGGVQKAGALGIGVTSPGTIPALLAAAPFTSPRLVGEGLYGLGRMSGGAGNVLNAGKQGMNRLAAQHPGLLNLQNALYRSLPVMATLPSQPLGLLDHDPE